MSDLTMVSEHHHAHHALRRYDLGGIVATTGQVVTSIRNAEDISALSTIGPLLPGDAPLEFNLAELQPIEIRMANIAAGKLSSVPAAPVEQILRSRPLVGYIPPSLWSEEGERVRKGKWRDSWKTLVRHEVERAATRFLMPSGKWTQQTWEDQVRAGGYEELCTASIEGGYRLGIRLWVPPCPVLSRSMRSQANWSTVAVSGVIYGHEYGQLRTPVVVGLPFHFDYSILDDEEEVQSALARLESALELTRGQVSFLHVRADRMDLVMDHRQRTSLVKEMLQTLREIASSHGIELVASNFGLAGYAALDAGAGWATAPLTDRPAPVYSPSFPSSIWGYVFDHETGQRYNDQQLAKAQRRGAHLSSVESFPEWPAEQDWGSAPRWRVRFAKPRYAMQLRLLNGRWSDAVAHDGRDPGQLYLGRLTRHSYAAGWS